MLGTALVAVVAGVRLVNGDMDFQVALGVLLLAPELYAPLRRVGVEYHAAADAKATLARVAEAAGDAPLVPPGRPLARWRTAREPLVLDSVTVRAPGRRAPILDGRPVAGVPGEVAAVVGASGAGKSTLLSLLLGLRRSPPEPCAAAARARRGRRGALARAGRLAAPAAGRCCPRSLAENLRIADAARRRRALWAALAEAGLADWAPGAARRAGRAPGRGRRRDHRRRAPAARASRASRCAIARLVLVDEPTANLDATTAALVRDALVRADRRADGRDRHPRARGRRAARTRTVARRRRPRRRGGAAACSALRALVGDRDPARACRAAARRRAGDRRRAGVAGAAGALGLPARAGRRAAPTILTLTVAIVGVRSSASCARPRATPSGSSCTTSRCGGSGACASPSSRAVPLVPTALGRRTSTAALDGVVADVERLPTCPCACSSRRPRSPSPPRLRRRGRARAARRRRGARAVLARAGGAARRRAPATPHRRAAGPRAGARPRAAGAPSWCSCSTPRPSSSRGARRNAPSAPSAPRRRVDRLTAAAARMRAPAARVTVVCRGRRRGGDARGGRRGRRRRGDLDGILVAALALLAFAAADVVAGAGDTVEARHEVRRAASQLASLTSSPVPAPGHARPRDGGVRCAGCRLRRGGRAMLWPASTSTSRRRARRADRAVGRRQVDPRRRARRLRTPTGGDGPRRRRRPGGRSTATRCARSCAGRRRTHMSSRRRSPPTCASRRPAPTTPSSSARCARSAPARGSTRSPTACTRSSASRASAARAESASASASRARSCAAARLLSSTSPRATCRTTRRSRRCPR